MTIHGDPHAAERCVYQVTKTYGALDPEQWAQLRAVIVFLLLVCVLRLVWLAVEAARGWEEDEA